MADVRDPTLTLSTRGGLFDAHRALRDRLLLGFPDKKFVHQVVPAQLSRPVFDSMVSRCPAVATGFVGLSADAATGRTYRADAKWMVFIAIRHPKPEGLLLGDGTGAVGQLGVVGLAVALLHGWTVRGLGTWRVGEVRNAYSDTWVHDDVALAAIEVSVPVEVVDDAAAAALPEFLRMGAEWALPDVDGGHDTLDDVRTAA